MGWIASFGIAIAASIVGLLASAITAGAAASWYRISSFEGEAGFFVLAMAFFGLVGGFLIGLLTARIVAGRPQPTIWKGLGASCSAVLAIVAVIGGTARMLADIPPEIDGESQFLLIELRWPAAPKPSPASMSGAGFTRLGAASGTTIRVQKTGPLFVEDARQEAGRWIVPGAVHVFTSRGTRVLDVGFGETALGGFIVPLPGHPGAESREWSAWLPSPRPGDPALPDRFTYRYRVIRESEPMRRDTIGPFEVDTLVSAFFNVSGSDRLAARSRFVVRHRGQSVGSGELESVAVLAGSPTALLAEPASGGCTLMVDAGDRPVVTHSETCAGLSRAYALTSDQERFSRSRAGDVVPGWIDRRTFQEPGLYLVSGSILDTRTRTMTTVTFPSEPSPINGLPPITLSPDERSFVWFTHTGSERAPVLYVTNWTTSQSYSLPIERTRMRYLKHEAIDPAWVAHHFEWQRGSDGHDILAARTDFAPLPYKGVLTLNKSGEYQAYELGPGGEPLRAAVVALLVSELHGERLADELNGYKQRVKVEREILDVTVSESQSQPSVHVTTYHGEPAAMSTVAAALDAAMATRKYDALFTPATPSTQ